MDWIPFTIAFPSSSFRYNATVEVPDSLLSLLFVRILTADTNRNRQHQMAKMKLAQNSTVNVEKK